MASGKPPLAGRGQRFVWWLMFAWFVFVNAAFYWHLLHQRAGELSRAWQRVLEMLQ